jgi:hypothetical protein
MYICIYIVYLLVWIIKLETLCFTNFIFSPLPVHVHYATYINIITRVRNVRANLTILHSVIAQNNTHTPLKAEKLCNLSLISVNTKVPNNIRRV